MVRGVKEGGVARLLVAAAPGGVGASVYHPLPNTLHHCPTNSAQPRWLGRGVELAVPPPPHSPHNPPACPPPAPTRPSPPAVPLAYVVLSWEPTRLSALALRGVVAAKEGLYWALIVAFPCGGWLLLFPVLVSLRFSRRAACCPRAPAVLTAGAGGWGRPISGSGAGRARAGWGRTSAGCRTTAGCTSSPACSLIPLPARPCRSAKVRRLALARIQKSTARRAKLPRHELAMAEALLKASAWHTVVLELWWWRVGIG